MSGAAEIGLPEALERAASELSTHADAIRPANGDPSQLAAALDDGAALAVLGWLLEHEPSAGEELALAWAEDGVRAEAVLGLSPDALPRTARKALRRAHHRLRSRGVAVPERRASATVATLPPLDEAIDEARVTALDPHGARLVYLASARAGGGVRLFQVAIDVRTGVLDLEVFEAGRARARRFLREAERRAAWPAVSVPPPSARALLAAAAARQSPDRSPPRSFVEWRSRLCDTAPDTPTPGALARGALDTATDDAAAVSAAVNWVREGRLGPWPPPVERLGSAIERLRELSEGVLSVSAAAREEQIGAALDAALGAAYDDPQREAVASGLEETAYVWWKTGDEEAARSALTAATAFRALPPAENPIARAMLEIVLRPAIERARQGKAGSEEGAGPDAPARD